MDRTRSRGRSRGGLAYHALRADKGWAGLGNCHHKARQRLALSHLRARHFRIHGRCRNAGVLHCLYPLIKRRIGRPRPFRVDPRLRSLVSVLDEHSFPSGHMMTLSGVLVPIVLVWPSAMLSAAVLLLVMAWSRIATAHHYPSDIFAGAFLGIAFACPLSICLLAL